MTVSNDVNKAGPYVGNASTTSFSFTGIKIFAKTDLTVVLTGSDGSDSILTKDSHYTVTMNNDQDASPGGSITYPITGTPLAADEYITILREIDEKQESDITNLGGFYPDVIENMVDRNTMIGQQNEERGLRSLRMSRGATNAQIASMEVAANTRSKYLTVGSTGLLETAEALASGTVLSAEVIGAQLYPIQAGETAAGVTPTYYQYPPGDARRYGAVGDDSTENNDGVTSTALQDWIDCAVQGNWAAYLPAGEYKYTVALTGLGGCLYYGDGMLQSALKPVGCHGIHIPWEANYGRGWITMNDMRIVGDDSGSWHGFFYEDDGSLSYPLYQAKFENMWITNMGGKGFYSMFDFSSTLKNIHVNNCGGTNFDLFGGPALLLDNCYAHIVAANQTAYRIRKRAVLLACNGVDGNAAGTTWLHCGETTADDGRNNFAYVTLIGCNLEAWGDYGIRQVFGGQVTTLNTSFLTQTTGTFEYYWESLPNNPGAPQVYIGPGTTFLNQGATCNNAEPFYAYQLVSANGLQYDYVNTAGTFDESPALGVIENTSYLVNSLVFDHIKLDKIDSALRIRFKPIHNVDSPYAIVDSDYKVSVGTDSGAVTINLPAVVTANDGRVLVFTDEDGNASVNNITLDADGTNKIKGSGTLVMNVDYQTVTLVVNKAKLQWDVM